MHDSSKCTLLVTGFRDIHSDRLQAAEAPLARQPADAKPAALAGEGRSSATSGKPARLGGTARGARTHFDVGILIAAGRAIHGTIGSESFARKFPPWISLALG